MGDLIAKLFEPYCQDDEPDKDEVSQNTRNSDKLNELNPCKLNHDFNIFEKKNNWLDKPELK